MNTSEKPKKSQEGNTAAKSIENKKIPTILGVRIQKIVVESMNPCDQKSLIRFLNIAVGDVVSSKNIENLTQKILTSGRFSNPQISIDTHGVLRIKAKINPIAVSLTFEGNKKIEKEILEKIVLIKEGDFLKEGVLEESCQRLRELYSVRGFVHARVKFSCKKPDPYRARVTFHIEEKKRRYIQSIRFHGVKQDLWNLHTSIASREYAWWRFLAEDDTYYEDRFSMDMQKLENLYRQGGYLDMRVQKTSVKHHAKGVYLDVFIVEGPLYHVASTRVHNESSLSLKDFKNLKALALRGEDNLVKKGERFDQQKAASLCARMNGRLARYNKVHVQFYMHHDIIKPGKVSVSFVLKDYAPIFVENVAISGNNFTHDDVIRRELELQEGGVWTPSRVYESIMNLEGLQYFDDVNIVPYFIDEKRCNAHVDLVEKESTGMFRVSGGYHSEDGAIGGTEFRESNWKGKGYEVSSSVMLSKSMKSFGASVFDPYVLSKNIGLSYGVELFQERDGKRKKQKGDKKSKKKEYKNDGLTFFGGLNYDLTRHWSYGWKVAGHVEHFSPSKGASAYTRQYKGSYVYPSISHSWHYRHMDRGWSPRKGFAASFSQGFYGCTKRVRYMKHRIHLQWFAPLSSCKYYLLNYGCEAAHAVGLGKKALRQQDRLNLGGGDFLGFSGMGPNDASQSVFLGGRYMTRAYGKVTTPLPFLDPKTTPIKLIFYTHVGSVWSSGERQIGHAKIMSDKLKIRSAAGGGIIWKTPIGASISMTFTKALKYHKMDSRSFFLFNIGTDL